MAKVLSDKDAGRLQKMLRWFEHSRKQPQQRRRNSAAGGGQSTATADLWLFEVQSAATGAGIYDCFQQSSWGVYEGPAVEVFNLFENYTVATPSPALALGDLLICYQSTDDEGNVRWVGVPVAGTVRKAVIKAEAGSEQYLLCNLLDADGVEITSGLGSGINIYFAANMITSSASWTMETVVPRVETGDIISVQNRAGRWECISLMGQSENKPC